MEGRAEEGGGGSREGINGAWREGKRGKEVGDGGEEGEVMGVERGEEGEGRGRRGD